MTGQKPLAVTMGDPAGIGGEITLMAWLGRKQEDLPAFFLIDDVGRLERLCKILRWQVPLRRIDTPDQAPEIFDQALPVLPHELAVEVMPGQADPRNGPAVLGAIERACHFVQAGLASAVVTNPIHKEVLYAAGFQHPGHTEFLADLAGSTTPPVMMLACPELRVVPVTIHLALAEAIARLDGDLIQHTIRTTADALRRDFALAAPRLAVSGLNPHAGEGGNMGREEIEILIPAIKELQKEGILVSLPQSADSLFHEAARRQYDAAICMYHDQALIPLKTIDFERGVNVTLGLPFIRTSPDHGTALNIAGRGEANPRSLIEAIKLAAKMAAARARALS
ncbi:MAG: 4-hydroxythreonine-4-phosphate dehydrogenase PdxA [Pseudomonadota bacterium]